MRKYILIITLSFISILGFIIIFLSTAGIKTNKFNNLINDKVKKFNSNLSLNINDVYLKLDISKSILKINTKDPKIKIEDQILNLSNIEINLDLIKFLNNTNSVLQIKVATKENSIKDLTNFLNLYSFDLPRFIIYNQIETGNITAIAKITPEKNNQNKFTYEINGKIIDASLNVLNREKFQNINFNFKIENQNLELRKIGFKFNKIKFLSDLIKISKKENKFIINGNFKTQEGLISTKAIKKFTNINLDFLENKFISGKTTNKFSFILNENKKIKNLNLESKINFDKIDFDNKIQDLIFLKNGEINAYYSNENLNIKIESQYQFINNKYNNKNQKDKIKFNIIRQKNNDFQIETTFKNKNNTISSSEIKNYLDLDGNLTLEEQNLTFGSDNKINFNIDKNLNIKNIRVKSKIELNELILNVNSNRAKKYFSNFKNKINFVNNKIDINYKKNKLEANIFGKYSLEEDFENFNINFIKNKESLFFNTEIETEKLNIQFNEIEYEKEKNIFSKIKLKGKYNKNKEIKFDEIIFLEGENEFFIKNLQLTKNDKIKNIDSLKLNYVNKRKLKNDIYFSKNKNNYILKGKIFDGSKSVAKLLKDNGSKNSLLNYFNNLNTVINFELTKYYIDKNSYLKNLNGKFIVKNNNILSGNVSAFLNTNNEFSLNIKTNLNDEKVTNLYIEKPSPFIKNYKFIKGFDEGSLSYDSIEKNGISKSNLKIYDFKVKKVPVLATLLSLASLQGIADLLTGEGIRFDEFEMDYETKNKLTKIKEIYAIGPAISLLMEGYIEKDNITSLRGTLVPATTINKTISKIPLLGNILVGKKIGEGVFGVSFKIKGPPTNLKTTVNPIKTLTPRFITRTLEKIKKN